MSDEATWTATKGAMLVAPRGTIAAGATIGGRFMVDRLLGEGSSGQVYSARDTVSDELVAIKLIDRQLAPSDAAIDRLRRELKAARRVVHPDVVRLNDLFEVDHLLVLSMELVEGETLAGHLGRAGPLDPSRLLALARGLVAGLAAAHRSGVVHRDLKPANVMVRASDGRPVLTDFGISRLHELADDDALSGAPGPRPASLGLTQTGAILGTPAYMAPEQLRGQRAQPSSDLYAVGLILWEAATGERPSRASSVEGLIAARSQAPKEPLSHRRPDLPMPFCAVVERCLAPDPAARPESAEAVLRVLDELSLAPVAPREVPARRRLRRAVLAGLAVGLGAAVLVLALRPVRRPGGARSADGGVHLYSLRALEGHVGWRTLGVDQDANGDALSIGGVPYAHGLFAHAPSELRFELGGRYTRLKAAIGLSWKAWPCPFGDGAQFAVDVDGRQVFLSAPIKLGDPAVLVDIDLKDAKELGLRTLEISERTCDATVWASPFVYSAPGH